MPSDERQQASASPQTALGTPGHPRAYSLRIRGVHVDQTLPSEVTNPPHIKISPGPTIPIVTTLPPSLTPGLARRNHTSHEQRVAPSGPHRTRPSPSSSFFPAEVRLRTISRLNFPTRDSHLLRASRTNEAFDTQLSPRALARARAASPPATGE